MARNQYVIYQISALSIIKGATGTYDKWRFF